MGWTTRGKVNVVLNSAVVTGVGSLFLQDGRIGDGFRGPDGRMYEVTNIATNTGLTIQPPYEGPTVNNATYYLAPFEGYVKDTADALRAASLEIGMLPASKQDKSTNLTLLSGLTSAADQLPYFAGIGVMSLTALTAKARAFLGQADEAAMRSWMLVDNPLNGTGGADLNTLTTKRDDFYIASGTNTPTGSNGYLTVIPLAGNTECYQVFRIVNGSASYERAKLSNVWTVWKKVLFVGDFGLGTLNNLYYQGGNLNADLYRSTEVLFGGFNVAGAMRPGYLNVITGDNANSCCQTFIERATGDMFVRTQLGTWNPWRRVILAGDYGFGRPLMEKMVTNSKTVITADPTAGVQFNYLTTDTPPGVADGALLTMAYNPGYAFQLLGDWRTGAIWTRPTAVDSVGADRPWTSVSGEYGVNANGQYWKFHNGLLICKINRTVSIASTQPATGVFFGAAPTWTFPVPFAGASYPLVVGTHVSPGVITWEVGNLPSMVNVQCSVVSMISIAARDYTQSLVATGTWK